MTDDKINRESNFELLRLFCILFVIILHYNGLIFNTLEFTKNASFINKYFIRIGESLCVCAVNVFLIITGYFLSKKNKVNIRKIINIFSVLIIFDLSSYLIRIFFGISAFKIKSLISCIAPMNYYAFLYSAVFLLSPFLNLVVKLENKKFNNFMIIIVILFSVFPTVIDFISNYFHSINSAGRSFVSGDGNGGGYTLVNFILLYYIGAFIKKNNCSFSINKSLIGYICSTLFILIGMKINTNHMFDYCNIFVISQGFFLFIIFKNIAIKSKIINYLAKSVWGMFIIHFAVMECIKKYIDIELVCNADFLHLFVTSFLVIFCSFAVSMILDIILRFVMISLCILFNKISILNKEIQINSDLEENNDSSII
ncbi:MAG: acyltransferase family protein [Treponema sp.]|nr:acyltransferase family protein [Treponema sp.]